MCVYLRCDANRGVGTGLDHLGHACAGSVLTDVSDNHDRLDYCDEG